MAKQTKQSEQVKRQPDRPLHLRTVKVIDEYGRIVSEKTHRDRRVMMRHGYHKPPKTRKIKTGIREFVQSLVS